MDFDFDTDANFDDDQYVNRINNCDQHSDLDAAPFAYSDNDKHAITDQLINADGYAESDRKPERHLIRHPYTDVNQFTDRELFCNAFADDHVNIYANRDVEADANAHEHTDAGDC